MTREFHNDPRGLLRALFDAAVAAAAPGRCLPPYLPPPPAGRCVVIGAGKAAAAMARSVEENWPDDPGGLGGLVVTRYGHGLATTRIAVIEAAHPVPDRAGREAAQAIIGLVEPLGANDLALTRPLRK